MNTASMNVFQKDLIGAENKIAALLSFLLPGLGQIYKGHVEAGLAWMVLGMPIAIFAGILLGLATAGIGLFLPLLCWSGLVYDAYYEKDLRKRHWFLPRDDGSELDDVAD